MADLSLLRGRRIAVTGASGFVGGRLCRALAEHGASVVGFGRRPAHSVDLPGVDYRVWDITTGPLSGSPQVDAVAHCAGSVTDWGERELFERAHIDGTGNVLASFPAPIPVVHISTASVYDPCRPKDQVREDAPLPRRYLNDYARTKAEAERLVLARAESIVLRPHAIYGPGDTVLLPRLLAAYRFGHLIAVGDGKNRISLTHVDNLVDAVLLSLCAALTGQEHGVFNVADASPLPLDHALRTVLRAASRAERVLYLPRPLGERLGAVLETLFRATKAKRAPRLTRYIVAQLASEYTLDISKARDRLGYQPTRDLTTFAASGALSV